MIDPSLIDRIIDTLTFGTIEEVTQSLRDIQRQWAADLEAYEVLDSRYRSMRDQLFALTNQMVHESNHIHDVREMRTK